MLLAILCSVTQALAGLGLAAAYWSRPLGDPFLLVPCIVLLALMAGFGQAEVRKQLVFAGFFAALLASFEGTYI